MELNFSQSHCNRFKFWAWFFRGAACQIQFTKSHTCQTSKKSCNINTSLS